jgi:predicted nucleic acid-binding protein
MKRTFLDTNVFVYADDKNAGHKTEIARERIQEVFAAASGVVSTQVLQEFFVVATKKLGVPLEVARRKVELISHLEVVSMRLEIILAAIDLQRLHSISFWDALIVRCAVAANCAVLLSEDLSHGQIIDGVRIENPFRV